MTWTSSHAQAGKETCLQFVNDFEGFNLKEDDEKRDVTNDISDRLQLDLEEEDFDELIVSL